MEKQRLKTCEGQAQVRGPTGVRTPLGSGLWALCVQHSALSWSPPTQPEKEGPPFTRKGVSSVTESSASLSRWVGDGSLETLRVPPVSSTREETAIKEKKKKKNLSEVLWLPIITSWISFPKKRAVKRCPRDLTHISYVSCIGRQILYH